MRTSKTDKVLFAIQDLEAIHQEFYSSYNADYWRCEIQLLKNCHDNFEKIKDVLLQGLDVPDADYKRVIRTELHFLYFQMIEALFSLIFAVTEHRNEEAWLALTFSDDRSTGYHSETYKKILEATNNSQYFLKNIPIKSGNVSNEIPFLRWVFYFSHPTDLNESGWEKNITNINSLLRAFARDFSDRSEYNAYKHSLRFFNSRFFLGMQNDTTKRFSVLGKSEDSIIYLSPETEKLQDGNYHKTGNVLRIIKPFDFERDYRCCVIISELIGNIVDSRRHQFSKETPAKGVSLTIFENINAQELTHPNTGTIKFSNPV